MIFRINRLRNQISEQLNREKTDWALVEKLNRELEFLMAELLHKTMDNKQQDK